MEKISRWPARVALLVSIAAFGATMGAFDAFGMTSGYLPMALQTSGSPSGSKSPSPSPSESKCQFAPAPPPICPTPTATNSSSASPSSSPSGSPSGGPGGEGEVHDSKITIDHDANGFDGSVRSVAKCERQRQVVVRKVRSGPDRLIGRDQTSRSGRWVVPNENTRRGKYYAKVLKRVFTQDGTQVTCRGARSETVTVV